ncbi:putative permease [Actinoplanes missouriensis 431]|uniref:Putative permease n=1 Tax=Actinoplanes missouriensis (strain ATCC 14538 / DSM 43046 / CBS 188.64 / JCM 3121 / NBRC 102363 / NCIMB 12654 / NRRL B-3342 / UNCC 431) TaxID=512565 RepID=I0H546_ACTM4|nr:FtsX-like permease family protein [Actinoplanes missouriensis]BAL88133.1 putative permease [Actinoplanes missouriensis 431]
MIRLAIGTLRRHRGVYLGTFVAALLAIALLASGGLLLASVLTARPPADRFAAATVVVAGPHEVSITTTQQKKKDKVKTKVKTEQLTGAPTLPVRLADRLKTLPSVTAVVADAAFPVRVSAPDGRAVRGADGAPVIGHGWVSAPLTPYTLRSGRAPQPGEVVVDAELARRAGDTVVITTRTGTRQFRVAGVAAPAGRDALPAQGAIFLADAEVAAVSGTDGPTALAIVAEPGADQAALVTAVREAAGDAGVFTGDDRARADLPGALPDYIAPISIFGFVLGLTGFAAVFVLTGTVTLGVRQRLRELALLRAVGATPRQLRRLLGYESVLLSAVASLGGAPLGIVLAEAVAARFRQLGVVPAQFEVRVQGFVLVAAAVAGMLVTLAGARLAARRAVRIAPTQALTETAIAPTGALLPRLLIAAVTTAGAITLLALVPLDGPLGMGMSFVATALLLSAVAALGPLLVRLLTGPLSRILGAGSAAGWLAGLVTRAERRRVAAVAVPLVLMFAVNAVMLLNNALVADLTEAEQAARTAPATAQLSVPAGLSLPDARRLAATGGVTGAAITLPTRVVVAQGGKPQDYAAQGLLTTGTESALDLAVRAGTLGGPGTLAASAYLARQYDWRIGDRVPVWLADGHQVPLRLTAVYDRARGFGDLVLDAGVVAAHDPAGLVGVIAVRYSGGVPDGLADFPGLRIAPTVAAAPGGDVSEQQGGWELMMIISLGFTAIAVVNTFAIATTSRRREYAGLRLAGATPGQLHRLAGREALITVAVGLALGMIVTSVVVGTFSAAQDGHARVIVDIPTYLAMLAGVGGLGLLAGALPIRLVVGRRSLPASGS